MNFHEFCFFFPGIDANIRLSSDLTPVLPKLNLSEADIHLWAGKVGHANQQLELTMNAGVHVFDERDFAQWLNAMKMVSRLPGGIPADFRRKVRQHHPFEEYSGSHGIVPL